MAKRARATAWKASIAGMLIRSTVLPTSPTAFRISASRWDLNIGRRQSGRRRRRHSCRRRHLRPHARRALHSRARPRRATQRQVHSRLSRASNSQSRCWPPVFPAASAIQSPNIHFYHEFTLRSHGVRRAGSAALDLAYVAAGRLDAFWEFNLNPWDTAAGIAAD